MAEETKNIEIEEVIDEKEVAETAGDPEGGKPEENQPSVQELLLELAKVKRQNDKLASESAEWKKKFRATQSKQEVADAEKAEAEAIKQEQFETMRKKLAVMETEKTYLSLGYTADEASRMAIAEVDNDFEAKTKIMQEVDARKKKAYEAEWIKSRPDVNVGSEAGEQVDSFVKGFNSVKPPFAR